METLTVGECLTGLTTPGNGPVSNAESRRQAKLEAALANRQKVIDALRLKRVMCRHEISSLTGLSLDAVRNTLQGLQHSRVVSRRYSEDQKDPLYGLTNEALLLPKPEPGKSFVPFLFGLEEGVARERVMMLKRLKGRLIEDLHPALNILISDYESGLKTLDLSRDQAEGDLE